MAEFRSRSSDRDQDRPQRREFSSNTRSQRREFVAKLKLEDIDYKKLDVLSRFLTPNGKIDVARRTGASRKQQHRVSQAIKRARFLALLPYDRDPGDNVRPRVDFKPRGRDFKPRDRDRGHG
jgi:small subunit ribosomal protein S18